MSVEQAKAFIERMKTDEAFREKVMGIEDAAGRIACIQSEGFECTPDEINEVAQEGPRGGEPGSVAGGRIGSESHYVYLRYEIMQREC